MPIIQLETYINAPIELCFDLARSIDLHTDSMKHTGEQAVAGRTNGLIELGDTVTWRAWHFGIRQTLTSKITQFDYPHSFTDEMVSGAFRSFKHAHRFRHVNGQTVMTDVFSFEAPFGLMGRLANFLFLKRYMARLLQIRNRVIRQAAEKNN